MLTHVVRTLINFNFKSLILAFKRNVLWGGGGHFSSSFFISPVLVLNKEHVIDNYSCIVLFCLRFYVPVKGYGHVETVN